MTSAQASNASTAAKRGWQHRVIQGLIRHSQRYGAFRARGIYSGFHRSAHDPNDPLAKSKIEYEDHQNLLDNFPRFDLRQAIAGKRVLDFGCGYGGRTVWFGEYAQFVAGTEVRPELVKRAREFAAEKRAHHVEIQLTDCLALPYPDAHFDVAFSFDVLEHVQDPRQSLDELSRVVKPGGQLILIFTPYYGIFSHHLNYISLFPALHWFFKPQNLVDAVNDLLKSDSQFATLDVPQQSDPSPAYNGRRMCLPTLNGLTRQEYIQLVKERGLLIKQLRSTPILEKFPILGAAGRGLNAALHCLPGGKELFSHNLVSILEKPTAARTAAIRCAA